MELKDGKSVFALLDGWMNLAFCLDTDGRGIQDIAHYGFDDFMN